MRRLLHIVLPILTIQLLLSGVPVHAQLNTDRITAIGRNALYFDDYVLAIQYFNQVIKLKPWLAEPYLYRAIAKIQLGDMAGAERDCSSAIQNNPFLPGAYYARGFVRLRQGHADMAENDFTEALVFAPDNKIYTLLRADARARLKHYPEALADIDELLRREPRNASYHFEKGTVCMAMQDTLCAFQAFSAAVEYDSQNPANWSARGLVNMMLEHNNEALLDLTKAVNLGSKWAGDYINRGVLFYKKHNYRGAMADYDKAVSLDPQDAQCYYNRGMLRSEVGDWNRALEDFDQAIGLEPDKTEMRYQRGVVHLQLRQWNEAVSDFDSLISRYPYFLPAYYLAAQAKTALDEPKAAWHYQQKAHKLEQNKEEIMRQQRSVNTDVQLAESQPQKRDRRKEFSNHAAQNQAEPQEEGYYSSETRGNVQKRHADVVNEPNIALNYYSKRDALRRTDYFHYIVDDYNRTQALPSPLQVTIEEPALTAELVNSHFDAITRMSDRLDTETGNPDLLFSRAVEFALVQDYSSAIDDCTRAIVLLNQQDEADRRLPIFYFCRANWRYKLLEYQRSTGELYDDKANGKLEFEMIMRDYDQVLRLQPDFAFAAYNKANMLCTQRDFDEAVRYYTQAISTEPEFAEAWFNRGLTRIYTDHNEEGLADLSKAGELGIYQAYNLIARFQ
ncbi:MAG: tetratricopeptide repeat protein [Paludibacteraceae bacterium]|nr:tetratricopeptide repeat protein [Paludibacteraceae bacterium]